MYTCILSIMGHLYETITILRVSLQSLSAKRDFIQFTQTSPTYDKYDAAKKVRFPLVVTAYQQWHPFNPGDSPTFLLFSTCDHKVVKHFTVTVWLSLHNFPMVIWVYKGSCILRPTVQSENYGPKIEGGNKWRGIYTENNKSCVTDDQL